MRDDNSILSTAYKSAVRGQASQTIRDCILPNTTVRDARVPAGRVHHRRGVCVRRPRRSGHVPDPPGRGLEEVSECQKGYGNARPDEQCGIRTRRPQRTHRQRTICVDGRKREPGR